MCLPPATASPDDCPAPKLLVQAMEDTGPEAAWWVVLTYFELHVFTFDKLLLSTSLPS